MVLSLFLYLKIDFLLHKEKDIELHGEFTTAKLSADHFAATGNKPNAKVAMEVDVDGFMDFFIERVKTL